MKKYIIERELPGIGTLLREQVRGASQRSIAVLAELGPDIQWVESYVTEDKLYCVYLAKDEQLVRKHARWPDFPPTRSRKSNASSTPPSLRENPGRWLGVASAHPHAHWSP